jgi:predicted transcriptional regulator
MNIQLDDNHAAGKSAAPPFAERVGRRRSNIEIIADMLRVGENGAGKTEIMYTANMSYHQIQKYLNYLVNQGFIHKVNVDNSMVAYRVTDSGFRLLKAIDTLMSMLEPATREQT